MDQVQKSSMSRTARIVVAVELLVPALGFLAAAAISVALIVFCHEGVAVSLVLGGVVMANSLLLMLVLMTYRLISWLIAFVGMADLLDATRVLLTGLFSPARVDKQ